MDYTAARLNMVEHQIRTNRILDPEITRALAEVPREAFVPKPMRGFAYVDEDLDVGGGRFLVEPLTLARLIVGAEIKKTDVVLTVGDATGYASAVIARLAQTVVSLESDGEWVRRSSQVLTTLGSDNTAVVQGSLTEGYPTQAPYDVILFVGGVGEIPAGMRNQLADGGRLVAVVATSAGIGRGTLVVRVGESFGGRVLFDAAVPMLPGCQRSLSFAL